MNSILTSIKKLLGLTESDTSFDVDIIMHINTCLAILTQMGVGPATGFLISDKTTTWSSFIGNNVNNMEFVKTYVYIKTRLAFDPPTSSSHIEALNKLASELEWRLTNQAEDNDD